MPQRVLSEQEFNAVRESVLASAPPNMDEATFNRWIGPQFAAAIEQAETQPAVPSGSAAWRAASNFGAMVNPITMVQGVAQAVMHPVDTATGIVNQMGQQWQQAGQAFDQGRYSEAIGHGVAGSLPVVGPAAAAIGEQIGGGDVAGGVGAAAGMIAPAMAVPAAKATGKAVSGLAPTGLKASIAERLNAGAAQRVADVMTPKTGPNKIRLGNQAAKVAPRLAAQPELAAWTRAGFEGKINDLLEASIAKMDAAEDARIVARTTPTDALIAALEGKKGGLTGKAVEGSKIIPRYADSTPVARGGLSGPPEGAVAVAGDAAGTPAGRLASFASPDEFFAALQADARRQGFQGSRTELREAFQSRLRDAQEITDDLGGIAAEHGPQALLQAIAKNGGIGMDAAYPGEIRHLWENSTGMAVGKGMTGSRVKRSRSLSGGGMNGVSGVLKKSGLSLDEMAERLRQDPRFEHIDGPNTLLQALDAARSGKGVAPGLSDSLDAIGVRMGTKWWEDAADVPFESLDATPPPAATPGLTEPARIARPLGEDVVFAPNKIRAKVIDQAIAELKQLGPAARYDALRQMRRAYDEPAKVKYAPAVTHDYLKQKGIADASADVSGVLREHLANMDPQQAAANAEYHIARTASDVLKAVRETEQARPKVGRQLMTRWFGAISGREAAGLPGAIAGWLAGPLIDSVGNMGLTTKLQTAQVMTRLAKAIQMGDIEQSTSLMGELRRLSLMGSAAMSRQEEPPK